MAMLWDNVDDFAESAASLARLSRQAARKAAKAVEFKNSMESIGAPITADQKTAILASIGETAAPLNVQFNETKAIFTATDPIPDDPEE